MDNGNVDIRYVFDYNNNDSLYSSLIPTDSQGRVAKKTYHVVNLVLYAVIIYTWIL